jgi:predicted Zn-dependent protease
MQHPSPSKKHALNLRTVLATSALAWVLSGCVATSPDKSGSAALGDIFRAASDIHTLAKGGSAATAAPGQSTSTGDVLQMLAQSFEQMPEAQEIETGRNLAAVLLGSKRAHPDAALQRYVNNLGRWISLQSSRPHLPWTFVVLDDEGFNAFAAPGGFVFVTLGLVRQARGEAELAGVLAHEITHVVQKHHLKALNKQARANLTQQLAKKTGNAELTAQLTGFGKTLYTKGLDRDDEFEADRKGVELAARAGLDPYGLASLLQGLASVRPDSPQYLLALSTHPATGQRLEQMALAMGNRLDAFAGAPPITVAQRVNTATLGLVPAVKAPEKPLPKPPAKKR